MAFSNYESPCSSKERFMRPQETFLQATTAPSIRTLSNDQNAKIQEMLSRSIHIRSKDDTFSCNLQTVPLIDSFVRSYVDLFFFIQGHPLNPSAAELIAPRHFTVSSVVSIRGSTNAALLQQENLNSDLDVVIKFSTPPPAFYDLSYFRSFCSMIGIYAFEMLLPDYSPSVCIESGKYLSCSPKSATLIDKTKGIFKSFFPFPDQSKCIYSFSGTKEQDGTTVGLDLDITLQFRPEAKIRIFRPISPRSSSSSSSDSSDSVAAPKWPMSGAQSFGHDAVELILPSYIGKIQTTSRPFFVGMFGLSVECVEKLLSERSLMILDPDMHLGYRRLFYEITRGRVPKMDNHLDKEETENVLQILSHVDENPISKIKPGLEPFQQFVKSKAEDPNFAIHFFMNAYMTVQLLIDLISSNDEPTREESISLAHLSRLSHILEREFIHDTWQELFPPLTQRLSQIENCTQAMMKIEEVKAHLSGFPENMVRLSLSKVIRVAGIADKKHGFIICKSMNIEEIIFTLNQLQDTIGKELFAQFTKELLGPIDVVNCAFHDKIKLLYTMRRLEQSLITREEADHVLASIPFLLPLWVENADFFHHHNISPSLCKFIDHQLQALLPSKSEREVFRAIIMQTQKEHDRKPSLMPRLIKYFIKPLGRMKEDLCDIRYSTDSIDSVICREMLSCKKLHESVCAGNLSAIKHLAYLSHQAHPASTRDIAELTKTILETKGKEFVLEDDHRALLQITVDNLIKKGQLPFFILHESIFKEHVILDFFESAISRPDILETLSLAHQINIFSRSLQEKKLIFMTDIFERFSSLALTLFKLQAVSSRGIKVEEINFLGQMQSALKAFLGDISCAMILKKDDQEKAQALLSHLVQYHVHEEVIKGICALNEIDRDLALSMFSHCPEVIKQKVVLHQPKLLYQFVTTFGKTASFKEKTCLFALMTTLHDAHLSQLFILQSAILLLAEYKDHSQHFEKGHLPFIEKILPLLQRARERREIPQDLVFAEALSFCQQIHQMSPLSDEARHILHLELCECSPDGISAEEYVSWAITQPITDQIVQVISKKISKTKMNEQVFISLREYFKKSPKFLRNLIKMAERSKLPNTQIEKGYDYLLRAETSSGIIQDDITKILSTSPSKELIFSVIDVLTADAMSPTAPIHYVVSLDERLYALDKDAYAFFLRRMINKILSSDDPKKIQKSLLIALHQTDTEDASCFFDMILHTLNIAQRQSKEALIQAFIEPAQEQDLIAAPLSHKLLAMSSTKSNLQFFEELMQIITRHTFKDPDAKEFFEFIRKKIFEIQDAHKASASRENDLIINRLISDYMKAFLAQLVIHHPEDLSLIWSIFNIKDLICILPQLASCADSIPESFIEEVIDIFARTDTEIHFEVLSCHIQQITETFCIKAEAEKALAIAILFKKICPNNTNYHYLISILFPKLLKMKDANILHLFKTNFMDALTGKEFERKKKGLRAELQAAVFASKPCDAIRYSDIVFLFSDDLQLETKRLLLHILKQKCKSPADEQDFSAMLILYAAIQKKVFSSLNKDEKDMLKQSFNHHYQSISFDSFLKNRHKLSHPHLQWIFSDLVKKMYREYGDRFISHITTQMPDEASYADIHLATLFLNKPESFLPDKLPVVHKAVDSYVRKLASTPIEGPYYAKCLTALLNFLIQTSCNTSNIDSACKTVEETHHLICGDNFVYSYDNLYLLSFNTCVQSLGKVELFLPLMEQLHEKLQREEISREEKSKLLSIFIDNFIPVILMCEDSSALPAEKVLLPLTKLVEGQAISSEHLHSIITLFMQFVGESLEKVAPHERSPNDLDQMYRPKDPSHIHLMHTLLTLTRSHLSDGIRMYNMMCLFKAISLIVQCREWIDETTIAEIPKICEKGLHLVLNGQQLSEGIAECAIKWKNPLFKIQQSSLHEPASLFMAATPVIMSNLFKMKKLNGCDIPVDIQKLQKLQRDFLIKIDDLLVKKSNKNIDQILFIYQACHPKCLDAFLEFFKGFYGHCEADGGIEKLLQNTRILLGLEYHLSQEISSRQLLLSQGLIEHNFQQLETHLCTIANIIFSQLETAASKGSGLKGIKLDEVIKFGIQAFLASSDEGLERMYSLLEKILHAETLRAQPDPNVFLAILDYMADISNMQEFNSQSKTKMKEMALRLWDPSKLSQKIIGRPDIALPTKVKDLLKTHLTSKMLSLFSQKSEAKEAPAERPRGIASGMLAGAFQPIARPELQGGAAAARQEDRPAGGMLSQMFTNMLGLFS
jgi:hypothetical protein